MPIVIRKNKRMPNSVNQCAAAVPNEALAPTMIPPFE